MTIYHHDRKTELRRSVQSKIRQVVSFGILGVSSVSMAFLLVFDVFFRSGELNSHPMESIAASAAALRSNAAPNAAKLRKMCVGMF